MNIEDLVSRESVEALKGVVLGEVEDLKAWGDLIAADAIRAAKSGRTDILAELREQAKGIAEMKRLKVNGFSWDYIVNLVLALAKVAVQALDLKEKLS